jgi:hypothetical protein
MRKLQIRLHEHERSCEGDSSSIEPDYNNVNGIPYHFATTGHKFLFDQTTILAKERNLYRRKIIEGIHIYNKRESCANMISGQRIDPCWNPILKGLSLQ